MYRDASPPAGVTVPMDWQVRQARNAAITAGAQVLSVQAGQSDAQARLDAANRLVAEAKGDYQDAARTVAAQPDDAKAAGVRADTWL